MNPFKNMAHILMKEELIDKAFRRASKIKEEKSISDKLLRVRDMETKKINTVASVITTHLSGIVRSVPSLNELDEFYLDMVEIIAGKVQLKKSLAALSWASQKISALEAEYRTKIKKEQDIRKIKNLRREFYGRVNSILKKIRHDLEFLRETRSQLIRLPSLKNMKTCVIAGYPNVGKSSLLKRLTGATPEIAEYPFTTKGIMLGYMDDEFQLMDTPGLLDRPPTKMNKIEKQAMSAITKKAHLLIFIFDASETCGYSLANQKALLNSLLKIVRCPVISVLNKMDLEYDEHKLEELKKWLASRRIDFFEASQNDEISIKRIKQAIREKLKDGENREQETK